ncbi:cytochrome o ubiquinol oxidase subunit IV [Pseudoduganella buxea]|uniref:Cytochrome bo(3) ubiquinol oxidase subunit 4 n=1 Tax=Pseudoduganella buxea TaxID=1949069 RepID=A0A6I3T2A4_9BURK|nr:cytochrome o ubiquinol oxidase subunit IV [Pseudoduganella buxea]MTV55529.1 cytochrome o ubiquinol oxidase subunit IV [Pseudoduganella buxea]GGB99714.1 cytochrome o ubiquinol oxidase subunit IV [Pseudoduganella buxea]
MSDHNQHHGHGHDHGHDDHGHGDHSDGSHVHGSMKDYVIGFVLAVILTAIPFWLVMNHVIEDPATLGFVLLGFAAVQMVVHMVYFLHMNSKSEGGWNMLALIFTVIIVVITLAGSLWVMYHMNHNMMPTMEGHTPQQMHDMP